MERLSLSLSQIEGNISILCTMTKNLLADLGNGNAPSHFSDLPEECRDALYHCHNRIYHLSSNLKFVWISARHWSVGTFAGCKKISCALEITSMVSPMRRPCRGVKSTSSDCILLDMIDCIQAFVCFYYSPCPISEQIRYRIFIVHKLRREGVPSKS